MAFSHGDLIWYRQQSNRGYGYDTILVPAIFLFVTGGGRRAAVEIICSNGQHNRTYVLLERLSARAERKVEVHGTEGV
jgi:hypothetical protein